MAIPNFNLSFYRYKPSQARRYMSNPRMKAFMHVQPRRVPLKTGEIYRALGEFHGKGLDYKGSKYRLDMDKMKSEFRYVRANTLETAGQVMLVGKTINEEISLLEFKASKNLRVEFFGDIATEGGKPLSRFTWLVETMLKMKCEKISFLLSEPV